MNIRLVNDTGTFLPSSLFVEATPTAERMWGLKKLNKTPPNLFTPHQDPYTYEATASTDIHPKLFHKFLSDLKLLGISPATVITTGTTEPITEEVYDMCREEIDLQLKI